jgi:hypothetical protein
MLVKLSVVRQSGFPSSNFDSLFDGAGGELILGEFTVLRAKALFTEKYRMFLIAPESGKGV